MDKIRSMLWLPIDNKLANKADSFTPEEKKELVEMVDEMYNNHQTYIPKKWKFSWIEERILDMLAEWDNKKLKKFYLFMFSIVFDTLSTADRIKIKTLIAELAKLEEEEKENIGQYQQIILHIMGSKKYLTDVLSKQKDNYKMWIRLYHRTAKESQSLSKSDISELKKFGKKSQEILWHGSRLIFATLLSPKKNK